MKKVSAIILSAGMGVRARALKPLLLWKEEETFLAKVYRSLSETQVLGEILAVTGFEHKRVEAEAKRLGLATVFNGDYEKGMHSSIRRGILSLKKSWDGVLIAHVDQPQMETEDFLGLVRAFASPEVTLARPAYRGRLGNPAIIGKEHLSEILSEPDRDFGCSYLFKRYPSHTLALEMPSARCLMDFDTPVDLISK
jgi:molybdenum cofactor cytidylyltransferase